MASHAFRDSLLILIVQSSRVLSRVLSDFIIDNFSCRILIMGRWQAIDAVDNGINQYNTDLSPKYVINTYLSSRVGRLNLNWTDPDQSAEQENDAFRKAMMLAGNEFLEVIFKKCIVMFIYRFSSFLSLL